MKKAYARPRLTRHEILPYIWYIVFGETFAAEMEESHGKGA